VVRRVAMVHREAILYQELRKYTRGQTENVSVEHGGCICSHFMILIYIFHNVHIFVFISAWSFENAICEPHPSSETANSAVSPLFDHVFI